LLALKRPNAPPPVLQKKLPDSSTPSSDSGTNAPPVSPNRASPASPKSSR
jgi:hypothetical protein